MIKITKEVYSLLNKKEKIFTIFLVLMMIFGAVLESLSVTMVIPLMVAILSGDIEKWPEIQQLLKRFLAEQEEKQIVFILLLCFALTFVVKNVYLIFEYYIQNRFIEKNKYKLQTRLMAAYMNKPYESLTTADYGIIFRTVTRDTTQADAVLSNLLVFFMEALVCLILGLTIINISPAIAIGMIITLVLELLLLSFFIRPKIKLFGKRGNKAFGIANKWLLEGINGIKSVKASNKEDYFEKNFSEQVLIGTEEERKYFTLNHINKPICEMLMVIGLLVTMLILISKGVELKSLIPELSAFAVAIVRLLPSVNHINQSINSINYNKNGLDNVVKALEEEQIYPYNNDAENKAEIYFNDSLSFNNVSFKYQSNNKTVINNASFVIPKGSFVGIVGKSGEGKTTIVDLILTLLKPTEGSILADGKNINDNPKSWLKLSAYVPQNVFLIDDSILANIAFGVKPDKVSIESINQIIKDVQLEEFINTLPDGIYTTIGENGVRLSGGQRQRIGIARALYNNPELILFDEATSSLDNETEKKIIRTISNLKGRNTMIMIAHRESSLINCDIIYRVEKGKVIKIK